MASEAQLQRERKAALRGFRRQERKFDSKLEVMEREIMRQQRRKTLLDARDGRRIVDMWAEMQAEFDNMAKAATDYLRIVGF